MDFDKEAWEKASNFFDEHADYDTIIAFAHAIRDLVLQGSGEPVAWTSTDMEDVSYNQTPYFCLPLYTRPQLPPEEQEELERLRSAFNSDGRNLLEELTQLRADLASMDTVLDDTIKLYKEALAKNAALKGQDHGFDRNASHNAGKYVCTCGNPDCGKNYVAALEEEALVAVNEAENQMNRIVEAEDRVEQLRETICELLLKESELEDKLKIAQGLNDTFQTQIRFADEELAALRKQVPQEVYVVVPREPTQEMLDAGREGDMAWLDSDSQENGLIWIYKAMIAAAEGEK